MKNLKKVLIIRFSSIGDIIITTPVIRCIKRQLNAEVHFLTYKRFESVIHTNPHIDRIISIEKLNIDVIKYLRSEQYDLIVDLHKNLKTFIIKSLLSSTSISFNKLNLQKWILVNTGFNLMPQKHLIDRYFEALADINVFDDGDGMEYDVGDAPSDDILSKLPKKYLCLVLGATFYTKRIPMAKCSELINTCPLPVVLLGGNDVISTATELEKLHPDIVNLVGKLSLQESAYCINRSQWVITGDTGMMHIAAALKKPIIMVWGGTSPEIGMYPYYGNNNEDLSVHLRVPGLKCQPCSKIGKKACPKGHFACMMKQDFRVVNDL